MVNVIEDTEKNLTVRRFGVFDGYPMIEEVIWMYHPDDPRSRVLNGEPGWFWLGTGSAFADLPPGSYHEADSPYWDYYGLPLQVGVTLTDEETWIGLWNAYASSIQTQYDAQMASTLLELQDIWDSQYAAYDESGMSEAGIISILGLRPTTETFPVSPCLVQPI